MRGSVGSSPEPIQVLLLTMFVWMFRNVNYPTPDTTLRNPYNWAHLAFIQAFEFLRAHPLVNAHARCARLSKSFRTTDLVRCFKLYVT